MPSSTGRRSQPIGDLWSLACRSARAHLTVLVPRPEIDPAETAEIEAMLAALDTDTLHLALRLSWRLRPLVQRSVPPRVIEAAPAPRAARLRFADGTTVVVKSAVRGDLAILAVAMRHGSVNTAACATGSDGSTHLLFTWPGGRRELSLRVVGLDQPD